MSSEVFKMIGDKSKSLEYIASDLVEKSIGRLTSITRRNSKDMEVILIVFERIYFRSFSCVNLSIMLTENKNEQIADIFASGGERGFLNLSWGANYSFASLAKEVLSQNGFSSEVRSDFD